MPYQPDDDAKKMFPLFHTEGMSGEQSPVPARGGSRSSRCRKLMSLIPSMALPLPDLSKALGVTFHGVLGRGKGGTVYELSGVAGASQPRSAGKLFVAEPSQAEATSCPGDKEHNLAVWAAGRGLGPPVYELRRGIVEAPEGGKFCVSALLMEKMDAPLNRFGTNGGGFSMCKLAWHEAFQAIAKRDFSVKAQDALPYASPGWLCCDDLKPENILVKTDKSVTPLPRLHLALADWDPAHWHSLPLPEGTGRFLNRLLLILNTVLSLRVVDEQSELRRIIGLWPESEFRLLQCLAALSRNHDKYLVDFACVYDKMLVRGAYHYACISGRSRRERAGSFLKRLEDLCRECLPKDCEPSARHLQRLQGSLRQVSLAYRRACLRKRGDEVAASCAETGPRGAADRSAEDT